MYFTAIDSRVTEDRERVSDYINCYIIAGKADNSAITDREYEIMDTYITHGYRYNGMSGIYFGGYHDTGKVEDEMKKISSLFGSILFCMTVTGPFLEQVRVEYFLNGKMEEFDDCLVFPPFQKSKLKDESDFKGPFVPEICTLTVSGIDKDLSDNDMEIIGELISAKTAIRSGRDKSLRDGTCQLGYVVTKKTFLYDRGKQAGTIPEDIRSLSGLFPDCLFTFTARYVYDDSFEIIREYFTDGKCQCERSCVHCPGTTLTLSNCG